ncbi:glucose dehydrogenase [FAD, quinone]-like [Agrilus planipennis]|uniref:Glucose dehydrogenase [FAD, quinone]-like n=1 Tax=Agrilus planipennis TaxID=224129 RepID=A0A1W4X2K4_AGRPL|nr:glucose dehydrogenase [FAD, quinone]-like [Agrilus planipennis]
MSSKILLSSSENIDGAIARAFLTLINVLIMQKTQLVTSGEEAYPKDFGKKLLEGSRKEFDFIIVGAGTAGSLIARRMSDYLDFKVLLVEAGAVPSTTSIVPYVFYTIPFTNEDWQFRTTKQTNACQGYQGKMCAIHRGKSIGGTSSINNMQYVRANPRDFDRWLIGSIEKWDMDTVTPLYNNLESCRSDHCSGYGTDGLINLETITDKSHHILDLLKNGIEAIGAGNVSDEYTNLGYFHTKAFVKDGQRNNFAKAFLSPIKNRNNLYFMSNATVLKVLFNSNDGKKATGIEVAVGGKIFNIKAKREVVLTAGSINTPKILMMSGIGKAKHLRSIGIEPIADLPVGENLQIQITFPIFVGLKHDIDESTQEAEIIDSIYEYVRYKRGKVAKTNVHGLVGLLNMKTVPYDNPTILMYHYYFRKKDALFEEYLNKMNLQKEIVKSLMRHNQENSIIIFMPTLIKPKSRGKVLLNCTNKERNPPVVMANFFSDPNNEDLQTLLSAFHYTLKLIDTQPYKTYKATLLNIDIPHCRNFKFCSEYHMRCMIKSLAHPSSNIAGTTKMGTICEPDTVLDDFMYVRKVRNLRVADASVFPEIVSGNTQATEAIVAERAAEYMRKKWVKNYNSVFPIEVNDPESYESLTACLSCEKL